MIDCLSQQKKSCVTNQSQHDNKLHINSISMNYNNNNNNNINFKRKMENQDKCDDIIMPKQRKTKINGTI